MDNGIWLDPTEEETSYASGSVIYACVPALNIITNVWQTGAMSVEQTMQVREVHLQGFFLPDAFVHSVFRHVKSGVQMSML